MMQCLSNDPGNDDCFSQVTDVLAVEDAIAGLAVSTGTKRTQREVVREIGAEIS